MARLVLRAVAGAVEATRMAARTVRVVLANSALRSTEAKLRRMAKPRCLSLRSPRPTHVLPAGLRRLIDAINRACWLEQQTIITLGQACRRFYLSTAAAPFTPYGEIELATRAGRAVAARAEWDQILALEIACKAPDRHVPPRPLLGHAAIRRDTRAKPLAAASVARRLHPPWAPLRPT